MVTPSWRPVAVATINERLGRNPRIAGIIATSDCGELIVKSCMVSSWEVRDRASRAWPDVLRLLRFAGLSVAAVSDKTGSTAIFGEIFFGPSSPIVLALAEVRLGVLD